MQPGPSQQDLSAQSQLFNRLFIYIAVATVGAKWLVVFRLGGMRLEMSNFGTLMLIGLLGLNIFIQRQFRAPVVLNVLLVLLMVLLANFSIRGNSTSIVIMSTAATLGAYAIVNAVSLRNSGPVFYAFLTFFGFFVLSAMLTGVDLIGGFTDYITTGNRDRFNYWVMRQIYNAFSAGGGGADAEFETQLNNSVAATYALIYVLAGSYALNGERRMIPVALISLLMVFAIFSSSAVLTCLLSSIIFGLYYLRKVKNIFGLYALFSMGIIGLVILGPIILDYMALNLGSDQDTRDGRLIQYSEALSSIEEHFLFGAGLIRVHGHYAHNFFLFAFTAVGLFGAFAAGFIMLYTVSISMAGLYGILVKGIRQPEILMVTCLPILFFIRSNVGGGGGLPTGAGLVAFALALVAWRSIEWPAPNTAANTVSNSSPNPGPNPAPNPGPHSAPETPAADLSSPSPAPS